MKKMRQQMIERMLRPAGCRPAGTGAPRFAGVAAAPPARQPSGRRRKCLRRHMEAVEQAAIRIQLSDGGEPVMVSADPHRLNQVLDKG